MISKTIFLQVSPTDWWIAFHSQLSIQNNICIYTSMFHYNKQIPCIYCRQFRQGHVKGLQISESGKSWTKKCK